MLEGDEDKAKFEERIAFSVAFKNSFCTAMICFAGIFFHPIYTMVNAMVLGHQASIDPLAGLGLGSLTIGICSLSIHWSFATGSGVIIAQLFGQKEYRMC